MIKQRKVIANPKGKTISEVLGIKDKKTSDAIIEFTKKSFHKDKTISASLEKMHKEAKNQEELLWGIFCLGIEKGLHIERESNMKKMADEVMGKLFGGSNKNDSFWATLDAIMVVFLFIGMIVAVENFPHNWWIIPLDLFLLVLTFWRRIK